MRKEVKCEDKGNLAGERQSGDGQVRWVIEKKMELRNHIQIQASWSIILSNSTLCDQESTEDSENKGAKPGQKLDDDQDRNNPAYIPRKGMFFEHDVRGNAQEEERYVYPFFYLSVKCLLFN